MSDTKTYTCVVCGDDELTGEPGAEAYLAGTPDGGDGAMCGRCIDRSMDAERAAEAALGDAGPSAIADATVRVLRAWATVDAECELYQARYCAREKRDGANEWTRNEIDVRLRAAERRGRLLGVGEAQDG